MPRTRRISISTASMSALATAAAVSIVPATASAQDNFYSRDKYQSVTERPQPEFNPEAVRVGSALLTSSVNAGVEFNDNIFATDTAEESDTIIRLGARGDLKTDWSRNELGASLNVQHREYMDTGDESHTNVQAQVRGRLDVTRGFDVGATAFAEDMHESRTAVSNGIGLAEPINYTRHGGAITANYVNDRVRWRNFVQLEKYDYDDGVQITPGVGGGAPVPVNFDQDFRDADVTTLQSRLSYAVSPNLAVFGQAGVRERDYDLAPGGVSRDSTGYTVQGGVNFELTTLVRGDIAVGYLSEEKDDAVFEDVNGLSVDADVEWFPSRLTTVTFNAGRRVVDLGLRTAPSGVQTTGGVRVDHELRRNIILSASVDASTVDFEDIDREDEYLQLGVGATYKVNKRVHVNGYADYRTLDLSGADSLTGTSYDQSVVGVAVRFFP